MNGPFREENTNSECPVCQSPNISPDDLIPSRKTRLAVQKFRNSQQLATATTAVPPENNDIKKPKSIINQIIENKMPSLPDIPGITVPKGNIQKHNYLIDALPKKLGQVFSQNFKPKSQIEPQLSNHNCTYFFNCLET